MDYLSVTGLITSIVAFGGACFIFFKNPREKLYIIFALGNVALALWGLGLFKGFTSHNAEDALFWGRFLNLSAIFIGIFLFHFNCTLSDIIHKKKKEIIIYYTITITYFSLSLLFPHIFVKSVRPVGSFLFYPTAGVGYYFFPVWYMYLFSYGIIILLKNKQFISKIKRNQRLYISSILILCYGGGGTTFFYVVGIPIPPYGAPLGPWYILVIIYVIRESHLMDINLAWRHVVGYLVYLLISCVILTGVYLLLMTFHSTDIFLIASCILPAAIVVPLCRDTIRKMTHDFLMRKYKKIWDKLKAIVDDKTMRYDVKDIVQIVIKDVPEALLVKNAVYYKFLDNGEKFESFGGSIGEQKILSKKNVLTERFETVKGLLYKEYLTDSEQDVELKTFLTEHDIAICSPVFFNRVVVGIIAYGEKEEGTVFHNEEIELLDEIIKNVKEQLMNVLYLRYVSSNYAEEVLRKYKNIHQLELLNAVKHLGSIRTVPELAKHTISLIIRYLHAQSARLYLYDESLQGYVRIYIRDEKDNLPELVKERHYLMKYLRYRKEVVFCKDLCKWAEESKSQEFIDAAELAQALKAALIVPLMDVTLLGFLVIEPRRDSDDEYGSNALMMLSFIGDRAEMAISNILVRERAERDELTGTHNKAYLNTRTRVEVANSLKDGRPLSYLIADADDFKWFNDTHGYNAGNEVLKAIVKAIEGVIRPLDEFCRWGGEELVMLALGANQEGARAVADKMLNAVRSNERIQELEKLYKRKITISIGSACFDPKVPIDEFTNEDIRRISSALFMRAGKALKHAKKNGKNQACESKAFTLGEEGEDKDIFPMRTLIVTKNVEYSRMHVDGVDVDTKDTLEEALSVCKQYDMGILDVVGENEDVEGMIRTLKMHSRDLLGAIISPYVKHRDIAERNGAKFFLSPLAPQNLEEWAEYLKSKQ